MRTKQEVFDTVATHLLTQNQKALNSDGKCRYRTSSGLTCAIGCLFPKNLDVSGIENETVTAVLGSKYAKFLIISDLVSESSFYTQLQHIHDDNPTTKWRGELVRFAENNNLNDDIFRSL